MYFYLAVTFFIRHYYKLLMSKFIETKQLSECSKRKEIEITKIPKPSV